MTPRAGVVPAVAAPSREDGLVGRLSAVLGGPAGERRAPYRGVWQAVSVLVLLAAVVMMLAVVVSQHCRAEGWTTPDQFFHACYSDTPTLYASAGLGTADAPGLPGAVQALGQPPLAGAALWLVGSTVGPGDPAEQALAVFDRSVVVLALALAVAVVLLAATVRRRPWDAAHLALSPVLVTAALISYDLLAVALVAATLLAWSRRHPLLAGVLLGAAAATRPLTAVVGLALLALAVRTARWRPVLVTTGVAVAVWLLVRVVLLPGAGVGVGSAYETWRAGPAGYGSLWLVPELLAASRPRTATTWIDSGLGTGTVSVLATLGLVLVAVGTVLLALAPQRRPRLAHVALFAAAGVLLVSKSVPPQAAVLLLPLVAAAGLRWRDHLVWAGAEVTYAVAVWLYIAGQSVPDRGLTAALYLVLLLVRSAALVWLMACAVRGATRPQEDLVRRPRDDLAQGGVPGGAPIGAPDDVPGGSLDDVLGAPAADVVDGPVDDPHGGPFEGAPDRLVVALR